MSGLPNRRPIIEMPYLINPQSTEEMSVASW